ncbi:hypothetical protein [Phormidesmis priestleyi]|uniref:hypothetical protein n=1 Tax=Phormidesmis priestleyi TaxID=268141 RepID=UPI001E38A66C
MSFAVDNFFALICGCYDLRADNAAYCRLTWAILGVATPADLIRDRSRTPFNIGQAIELQGFQDYEVSPLSEGLMQGGFIVIEENSKALKTRSLLSQRCSNGNEAISLSEFLWRQ